MTKAASLGSAEMKRVGKFGLVGIINTAADFLLYNLLFAMAGFDVRVANIISTTVAMVISFFANQKLVFERGRGSFAKQAIKFYLVTAFGLYILQTGTIHLLTDVWTAPLHFVVLTVHTLGLSYVLPDTFVINNGAKAIGTVVSLTWNYVTYKKVVFL